VYITVIKGSTKQIKRIMNELHHHQSTNQITELTTLPTNLTQPDTEENATRSFFINLQNSENHKILEETNYEKDE